MAKRKNLVKVTFILVCFFGMFAFNQEKQVDEDKNKKLREEILVVYQSNGEQGLLDFVKKQKDNISGKFIVDFAKSGVKKRKEEWLKICKILAEEKKDEKTLADVLYQTGEYFRLISDNKKATDYFDNALLIYQKLNDTIGQGNVYLSKGEIHYLIGNNSNALSMYDKALSLFEKDGFSVGQGNAFLNKGNIYYRIGDSSKALAMYEKALHFFKKAGGLIGPGNVYLRKGIIFSRTGEINKALEVYDKALHFFEKSKYLTGLGNVYYSKGNIYFHTGENHRAFAMYNKALSFFEKVGNLLGQGNVYLRKGNIYLGSHNYSEALNMYNKAITFFEKVGTPIGQGNVYQSIGDIYAYSGKNSKALDMYERSLSFYEKAKDVIGQGYIHLKKGNIYLYCGEYSSALDMYSKAQLFFQKTGSSLSQGNVYFWKGNIYLYMGEYSYALALYNKALIFFKEVGSPVDQGNVYIAKGDIYYYTGDYSRAFEMFNKAHLFFKKVEDTLGLGNAYFKMAGIHVSKGQYAKAHVLLDKALLLCEKTGEPIGLGSLYQIKGDIYFILGENLKAIDMYDKALLFFDRAGAIRSEFITLHLKAKSLVKLGKKSEALVLFEKSISKLEKVRTQTTFSEMKRTFMEKVYKHYEESVLFMLEDKYYDKGFKYAEAMKARVFLDQMTEGLMRLEKGLKSELREERDRLVGKLSALTRQMQETGGKDEKKLKELEEEYLQVESQFEDLLIKIRLENPLYASVNYPQPLSVHDLQTDVLKKGEILLSYFISPEKAYAFIVSKEKFKVKQLKVKENEINGYVERYLHSIKENNTNDVNKFGSILYEKLFKPLEKYLKNSREIIIVPAGQLETIPFESLIIDRNKSGHPVYLLEKYRIKYLQSASLLSVLRKHYAREGTGKSFIGFGDPVYDYENFKQGKPEQGSIFSREDTRSDAEKKVEVKAEVEKGVPSRHLFNASGETLATENTEDEIKKIHRQRYARAGGVMDRLPYSGEEIKTIARLFEKESLKTVVHLREKADEENAKVANMKDFDYIHFSCHGLLNNDFQSLVLSQLPPEKSKEDGYFTLNEIMNCDYNAKLVVLSACETGSGKMYKGEGVTGLTRAVMYAGTPAIIGSLWKVDDIATRELMVNFYRNILEKNMNKTEALRRAKLELLKEKNYSSPLFWSAFVLYGE